MKMNWGKGLAIALTLFIGFITTLVIILISQDVDLVKEDYYKSEMEYQQEIDALKSGHEKEKFEVSQVDNQLLFQFDAANKVDSIQINLWRPNNEALDRSFSLFDSKQFLIPVSDLVKGNYTIRCQFWNEGETYVQEKSISIKA